MPGISEVEAVEEVTEDTLPVSSSCRVTSGLDATTPPFVPTITKSAMGFNPRAPPFTSTTSFIPNAVNSSLSLVVNSSSSRRPYFPQAVMPNTTSANTILGHSCIPCKPYRTSNATFIPMGWHVRRDKSTFVPPSAPTAPLAHGARPAAHPSSDAASSTVALVLRPRALSASAIPVVPSTAKPAVNLNFAASSQMPALTVIAAHFIPMFAKPASGLPIICSPSVIAPVSRRQASFILANELADAS